MDMPLSMMAIHAILAVFWLSIAIKRTMGRLLAYPTDLNTTVGQHVIMPCVTNLALPVYWYFNGHEIFYGGKVSMSHKDKFDVSPVKNGVYNLSISSVDLSHSGEYICGDDEGQGERKSARLHVTEVVTDMTKEISSSDNESSSVIIAVVVALIGLGVIIGIVLGIYFCKKKKNRAGNSRIPSNDEQQQPEPTNAMVEIGAPSGNVRTTNAMVEIGTRSGNVRNLIKKYPGNQPEKETLLEENKCPRTATPDPIDSNVMKPESSMKHESENRGSVSDFNEADLPVDVSHVDVSHKAEPPTALLTGNTAKDENSGMDPYKVVTYAGRAALTSSNTAPSDDYEAAAAAADSGPICSEDGSSAVDTEHDASHTGSTCESKVESGRLAVAVNESGSACVTIETEPNTAQLNNSRSATKEPRTDYSDTEQNAEASTNQPKEKPTPPPKPLKSKLA